jgi:hypothetical protein
VDTPTGLVIVAVDVPAVPPTLTPIVDPDPTTKVLLVYPPPPPPMRFCAACDTPAEYP